MSPVKKTSFSCGDDELERYYSTQYHSSIYDNAPVGFFLGKSHQFSEKTFGKSVFFSKVLEVGAGSGEHLKHVQHGYNEYWQTDLRIEMIEEQKKNFKKLNPKNQGKILIAQENAVKLSFPNDTFDRLIAAHILVHLIHPEEILKEWTRVLKPGGTLTLLLPCDPGMSWRLGRYLVSRPHLIKKGIPYDYLQALDHVNPINNLISIVRHYFPERMEKWYPFSIPSIDLNLFFVAHIKI